MPRGAVGVGSRQLQNDGAMSYQFRLLGRSTQKIQLTIILIYKIQQLLFIKVKGLQDRPDPYHQQLNLSILQLNDNVEKRFNNLKYQSLSNVC